MVTPFNSVGEAPVCVRPKLVLVLVDPMKTLCLDAAVLVHQPFLKKACCAVKVWGVADTGHESVRCMILQGHFLARPGVPYSRPLRGGQSVAVGDLELELRTPSWDGGWEEQRIPKSVQKRVAVAYILQPPISQADPDLPVHPRAGIVPYQHGFWNEGRYFRSTGGEVVPAGIDIFSRRYETECDVRQIGRGW